VSGVSASTMAVILVRASMVVLSAIAGWLMAAGIGVPWFAGLLGGALLGGLAVWLEWRAGQLPLEQTFWGVVGGALGLLAGYVAGTAVVSLVPGVGVTGRNLPELLGAYLGAMVALRRRADLDGLTAKLFSRGSRRELHKVLDTSVIIDGRIGDVCEAGFLEGTLVVPQFVLRELQQVADSSDTLKRNRGKRGFDVLQRLQRSPKITVQIHDLDFPHIGEVDGKLIELAKFLGGKVITNDYNLNKLAELRGVPVLNINELANSLRPVVLPGELMQVRVLKEGKEANQGIAYLNDGTMVVVEQGRKHLGQSVDVTVTSVLQTTAGRMIFTRLRDEDVVVR
jgi:uncharacterized protein YacL